MAVRKFSALIEDIYSLCLDQNALRNLLHDLVAYFNCQSAGLHIINRDGLHIVSEVSSSISEMDLQAYARSFSVVSALLRQAGAENSETLIQGPLIYEGSSLAAIKERGCSAELAIAISSMTSIVFPEGQFYIQLVIQSRPKVAFDHKGLSRRSHLMMKHIHKAFEIYHAIEELRGLSNGFEQIVNGLDSGAILFNGLGEAVYQNKKARNIIGLNHGLSVISKKIFGQSSAETNQLREMINATIAHGREEKRQIAAMKVNGGLFLVAVPLSPSIRVLLGDELNIYSVLLIGSSQMPSPVDAEILRLLYNLTLPEAKIVAALSQGISVSEYCESTGISVNTARGYIKLVLQKTGTKRQGELIALLRNIPSIQHYRDC